MTPDVFWSTALLFHALVWGAGVILVARVWRQDRCRATRSRWLTSLAGTHAPDFVDALPVKVDLVLAGHTHGGQVVIPFFGPPVTASRLPRKFAGDLHDFRGIPLHVSRGVGMERAFSPPVRFFCPPEICVLDVRLRAH
jgi:predicted MPP superfamily phosphohydrolase